MESPRVQPYKSDLTFYCEGQLKMQLTFKIGQYLNDSRLVNGMKCLFYCDIFI